MSYLTKNDVEADLLHLQKADETRFIELLFKHYYASLCRTVNRIVRDTDAAEDIVQDVFMKVWNNRQTLEINFSIKSYLYRSAINSALNYLEKNKKQVHLEDANLLEPSGNNVEEMLNAAEVQQRVFEATEALPPACKTIFVLSRHENMSYKEIADTLNISPKTVENQMGKALKHFREYLNAYIKHLFTITF
ncbi:RNA polymerase sigma-70 factor [Rhodocytophaga aerolata]|uniref:RNA polymerase sigma-70 factor n=1 Tax=Rhodocytophaga aerolata TaxID=455078 RepID=A0ABT8R4B9_9BACT|nr:RNA polymerase sigma-70 factor [Rhodocytophaga aerolata]MDO1446779.1 RNA polymerase sigma-70 factor [Rhodocytophaga aerolata]